MSRLSPVELKGYDWERRRGVPPLEDLVEGLPLEKGVPLPLPGGLGGGGRPLPLLHVPFLPVVNLPVPVPFLVMKLTGTTMGKKPRAAEPVVKHLGLQRRSGTHVRNEYQCLPLANPNNRSVLQIRTNGPGRAKDHAHR